MPPPMTPAFEAEPEEMPQEAIGDVAVAGADKMQDFHDRAVCGHRAAGGERHRDDGGDDHQRQNADACDHGGAGHRAHPLDPGAMIVDACGRRGLRHAAAQRFEIDRRSRLDTSDKNPRHRKVVKRQPAAKPWLQQLGGLFPRERPDVDNAGLRPHRVRHGDRVAIEVTPGRWANLDGDFARRPPTAIRPLRRSPAAPCRS